MAGGKNETINFGIPDTDEELDQVFQLRYTQYSIRKYIDPTKFPDGKEKDEYDNSLNSKYFFAVWNDKVIATIRLIQDYLLPTQKAFDFAEPQYLSDIPTENRAEFGRFIIIPLDIEGKKYLPRRVVMLVLFQVLLEFCVDHNIKGGYSFLKKSLHKKMKRLRMPIQLVAPYKQKYPKHGVLFNYFSQPEDPVIPIAFIVGDFKTYLSNILSNRLIFRSEAKHSYIKDNLFTKLFSYFNVI